MPLLIDGHNLIGQMDDISLADPDDEAKLLARLQRYYHRTREPITVVFDPGDVRVVGRARPIAGVTVIYAPYGGEADTVLIRRIEREKEPRRLVVVSSDRHVAGVARVCGAQVIKAQNFARTLADTLNPPPPSAPVEDKPAPSSSDVDYWLRVFKEPPRKPRKRRDF